MHFLMFFVFWVFFWGGDLGFWGGIPPPQEIAGNNTAHVCIDPLKNSQNKSKLHCWCSHKSSTDHIMVSVAFIADHVFV